MQHDFEKKDISYILDTLRENVNFQIKKLKIEYFLTSVSLRVTQPGQSVL